MTRIKDAESLKKFGEELYKSQSPEALTQRTSFRNTSWYIFGLTPEGTPIVLGPKSTEAEVVRIGEDRNLVGPQDDAPYTYELDTIDINSATRSIKADLLERGIDTKNALRRVRHK